MLFEVATITAPPDRFEAAVAGVDSWVADADARGELLGIWRTEIGTLGRLVVLRYFAAPHDMTTERHRGLMSVNPFNVGAHATSLEMDSYASFAFLPPVRTGSRGGLFEWRTDQMNPGGLRPILDGWEAAREPCRILFDHLVLGLYALDGPTRIAHLWGFDSLAQRAELHAEAAATGAWPPRNGADLIAAATSVVASARPGSPLH